MLKPPEITRASLVDLLLVVACVTPMDGSVKPEGIELTYHNSFPAATFHRMMCKHEFEASELGLTFWNCA
jgi:hypothetical protein